MRPSHPVESTPAPTLHPVLAAALSSSDAQLEEELTRYRRHRGGRRTAGYAARKPTAPKQLDLIAIDAIGGRTHPAQPAAEVAPSTADPFLMPDPDPWQSEEHPAPMSAPLAIASEPIVPAALTTAQFEEPIAPVFEPESSSEPDDYLASSEELLKSLAEEEAELRAKQQEPGLLKNLLTPLGIGSLLLLLLSSTMLGYVLLNPASLKLLKLERLNPEAAPSSEPSASTNSSASAPAYPDLSTEEFRDLSLDTLGTLPTHEPSAPAPTTAAIAPSPLPTRQPTSSVAPSQPTPALLSESRQGGAPAPAAAPPASARRSLPPATVQRTPARSSPPAPQPQRSARSAAPSPARSAAPAPQPSRAAAPQPRPAPAAQPTTPPAAPPAPAPTTSSAPQQAAAPQDYYYVVTPYSGDRSLEEARQAVGDAYVRNFSSGAQVQMGAFTEQSRAQELRQQLQQQGIQAEILEGTNRP